MTRKKKNIFGCGCLLFLFFIFSLSFALFLLIRGNRSRDSMEAYVDPSVGYIKDTKDMAINTAKRYDLFPSVVMAQSALESNWGTSVLSKDYNNYFGVKATKGEEAIQLETEEVIDGVSGRYLEDFRQYKSKKDSFHHYGKLISQARRYEKVRQATNYQEAAMALQECGYATDPHYGEKLISIIERYGFAQWDL